MNSEEREILRRTMSELGADLAEAREDRAALRAELVRRYDQIEALKKELEALKGIERRRWENVNTVFGTKYRTQMNEGESAKWTGSGQTAAQWSDGAAAQMSESQRRKEQQLRIHWMCGCPKCKSNKYRMDKFSEPILNGKIQLTFTCPCGNKESAE